MKLLDYSGLQRFLNKIKTLLDSKSNTGHTHVTSEVTDLLNSQHTWSAQQSYSADLNLNYASTDVDDILDTVAGSYTAEDFLAQNNVWTGSNTYTKTVAIERNKDSGNFLVLKNTEAELGSLPSSITPATIAFRDKNDENLSYMGAYYDTDGSNRFRLYVKNKFTSGAPDTSGTEDFAYFGLRLNADNSKEGVLRGTFRPYDNNSYDLGSSSYQWNNLYAKKYYYNGTQWGLDQANEWSGDNTFKGIYQNQGDTNFIIPRGTNTIKGDLTTSGSFTLMFKDKNNGNLATSGIGYLTLGQNSSGSYATIGVETVGSTDNTRHSNSISYKIDPTTNDNTAQFYPVNNNATDLGISTNQWNNIYAKNYFYNGTQWGLDQANVWTSYQQMVGNPTVWNMKNNSITMGGTQPSSNRYLGMIFYDSTDVEMGRMCLQCHKNGYNYYVFSINNSDGTNSYNGSVRMAASRAGAFTLYPDAGTWNLGDTGTQWANTYTTNLSVSGTGTCTTPAVADNSTNIATTEWVTTNSPFRIVSTDYSGLYEFVNLADSDHIATGFNGMVKTGIYHIRSTADVPGTPFSSTFDGVLVVHGVSSCSNVSTSRRKLQIFYTVNTSATLRMVARRGSYGSSGWTWDSSWIEYAKTSDIPTAVSQLTNDSGFVTTDNKVDQSVSTANNSYPILISTTPNATANLGAKGAYFSKGAMINARYATVYLSNKYDSAILKGTRPTATKQVMGLKGNSYDDAEVGVFVVEMNKGGYNRAFMRASNWIKNGAVATDGTMTTGYLAVDITDAGLKQLNTDAGWGCNVNPVSNNSKTLGTSSLKWKEIHGVTIYENGTKLSNKYQVLSEATSVEVGLGQTFLVGIRADRVKAANVSTGTRLEYQVSTIKASALTVLEFTVGSGTSNLYLMASETSSVPSSGGTYVWLGKTYNSVTSSTSQYYVGIVKRISIS